MNSLTPGGLTSPRDVPNVRGQLVSPYETASKTENQQQQEQQPTPKYTTVGSVYNPQASQPLQPPARRGRTIKWPPTPHSDSPHPLLPKSAFSALSYRNPNPHIPQTPPATLGSFQHYSPLRQNFDRAVSPSTSPAAFNFGNNERDVTMQMPANLDGPLRSPTELANILRGNSLGVHSTVGLNKDDAKLQGDDGGDDEDDDVDTDDDPAGEPLRRMSVKSLTNLASYLNPMQKPAQKLLSKAQLAPILTNPYAQEMLPSYQPQDFLGEQRSLLPDGSRHTRSDPVAMGNLLQSDRAGESSGRIRPLRIPPGFDFPPQRGSMGPGYQALRDSTPGALARGTGVPQPLTAGPPGQRQYRTSALESMDAMPNSFRRSQDIDEETLMPNPYNAHIQHHHPQYSLDAESNPAFDNEGLSSIREMLAQGKGKGRATNKSKVVDTLSAEDVSDLYPEGFPANFGVDTMLLSRDWAQDYPLDQTHERRRAANITEHMSRTLRHFYSGADMFNKTIDEAIQDRDRRAFHRTLGVIGGERKKAKNNPELRVEDAAAMPTHEHAEPLLNMAFQTFLNCYDTQSNDTLTKSDGA